MKAKIEYGNYRILGKSTHCVIVRVGQYVVPVSFTSKLPFIYDGNQLPALDSLYIGQGNSFITSPPIPFVEDRRAGIRGIDYSVHLVGQLPKYAVEAAVKITQVLKDVDLPSLDFEDSRSPDFMGIRINDTFGKEYHKVSGNGMWVKDYPDFLEASGAILEMSIPYPEHLTDLAVDYLTKQVKSNIIKPGVINSERGFVYYGE